MPTATSAWSLPAAALERRHRTCRRCSQAAMSLRHASSVRCWLGSPSARCGGCAAQDLDQGMHADLLLIVSGEKRGGGEGWGGWGLEVLLSGEVEPARFGSRRIRRRLITCAGDALVKKCTVMPARDGAGWERARQTDAMPTTSALHSRHPKVSCAARSAAWCGAREGSPPARHPPLLWKQ